jgi:anion-transporting  ArsA/GET3 family ATPase
MGVPNDSLIHKQRIDFVTGKGGVGKSLVAAALACRYAEQGERVLLAELGPTPFLSRVYGTKDFVKPGPLAAGVDLVRWSGPLCLREYILYYVRFEKLVDLFFENKVMGALVRGAPALNELALTGKITSHVRGIGEKLPYDRLVIDAFATGHFLALLRAPVGLNEAVKMGPMGEQTSQIVGVLRDPKVCQYHVVSLPEELPTQEALDLAAQIETDFRIRPRFLLNRVWPDRRSDGGGPIDAFTAHWDKQVQRQRRSRAQLSREEVPPVEIPFLLESDPWRLVRAAQGVVL